MTTRCEYFWLCYCDALCWLQSCASAPLRLNSLLKHAALLPIRHAQTHTQLASQVRSIKHQPVNDVPRSSARNGFFADANMEMMLRPGAALLAAALPLLDGNAIVART